MVQLPSWYGTCNDLRQELNETSNPIEALFDIARGSKITLDCYNRIQAQSGKTPFQWWMLGLFDDLRTFWSFTMTEFYVILGLTLIWTLSRIVFVHSIFEPFGRWVGVMDNNIEKFGEAMWKFVAVGFMWVSALYVTFFRGYDFFQRPTQMWADHNLYWAPFDLKFCYAIESSFYVHSIYATAYMDAWRKDSVVMIVHHLVTLSLIGVSYSVGFLKIGVLVFVLDDVADVILESGKAATYMRHRKTGFSTVFNVYCNVGGVLFAVQWAVLRLQMHLTKVWRAASIGIWVSTPNLPIPHHMFYITFLGSLFLFYSYWFFYIFWFVVRILRGTNGLAEDPREDEERKKKASAAAKLKEGDGKKED